MQQGASTQELLPVIQADRELRALMDEPSRDAWLSGTRDSFHTMQAIARFRIEHTPSDRNESLQSGVDKWMDACFGEPIKSDQLERADRFIEEALELAQTMPGFTKDRGHALVDYVFDRPQGDINQEVGGVMITLAALCNVTGVSIDEAASTELARIWTKVEQIRAKQAAKPTGSALPIATTTPEPTEPAGVAEMKADLVHFAKLIFKLDATVSNLVTGLEDEGDRIYLGSTNDADQLRELSSELEDAFYSTKLTKYSEGRDVWAEMRELRERITELETENFRLAAGQCVVENGLVGDEHGHFDCSLMSRTPPLLEVAKEALEPFAEAADNLTGDEPDQGSLWESPEAMMLEYRHLRNARAAFQAIGAE